MSRNPEKFTLWWISGDRQASMWGGDYETKAEAEAAIPAVESEFRGQLADPAEWDQQSIWEIEPPEAE